MTPILKYTILGLEYTNLDRELRDSLKKDNFVLVGIDQSRHYEEEQH